MMNKRLKLASFRCSQKSIKIFMLSLLIKKQIQPVYQNTARQKDYFDYKAM